MITIKCKSKVAEQLLLNELKYNKNIDVFITEDSKILESNEKEYEDSGAFTDDMDMINSDIIKIKKIITSKKWNNWMKITDENYKSHCSSFSNKTIEDLEKFQNSYDKLIALLTSLE